jgi:hypothetical protein
LPKAQSECLARRENAKQVLWKVLADRLQRFGRIASKKPSSPLSDQLIAFQFAVKLLDDLGVEFRMKTGRHGITVPQLPDTIVLSFDPACPGNRQRARLCRDVKIGGDDISVD